MKDHGLSGVKLIELEETCEKFCRNTESNSCTGKQWKATLVAEKLRKMNLNKVAEFVKSTVEETLSYMDFPYEHWTRLRTNNALERIMKRFDAEPV